MKISPLPTGSKARKEYPMYSGLLQYFPAALAGVARHSKLGNDQHNLGEPLHHARGKSMDHENCIIRHLVDLGAVVAAGSEHSILEEADAICWRALALSQQLYETYDDAPMAPAASYKEVLEEEVADEDDVLPF